MSDISILERIDRLMTRVAELEKRVAELEEALRLSYLRS